MQLDASAFSYLYSADCISKSIKKHKKCFNVIIIVTTCFNFHYLKKSYLCKRVHEEHVLLIK